MGENLRKNRREPFHGRRSSGDPVTWSPNKGTRTHLESHRRRKRHLFFLRKKNRRGHNRIMFGPLCAAPYRNFLEERGGGVFRVNEYDSASIRRPSPFQLHFFSISTTGRPERDRRRRSETDPSESLEGIKKRTRKK